MEWKLVWSERKWKREFLPVTRRFVSSSYEDLVVRCCADDNREARAEKTRQV
jgi:hypothetical protein